MRKEILDNFEEEEEVNIIGKHLYILPYSIQFIGLILCTFYGMIFLPQYLIAAILLVIVGIIMFFDKFNGIFYHSIVSIFSSLNLIHFFPMQILLGPRVGEFGIEAINIIVFGLILHFNGSVIKPKFQNWLYGSSRIQSKTKNSKIQNFELRFRNKSLQELEKISTNSMLVEEARKAAINIIKNREISSKNTRNTK